MTLNLIKLAVGIEDLDHLERRQRQTCNAAGNYRHRTRMTPKREAELLDGGAMYWVIRGLILVRQPILSLGQGKDEHGKPLCVIELAPRQILVCPRAQRPCAATWQNTPKRKSKSRTWANISPNSLGCDTLV